MKYDGKKNKNRNPLLSRDTQVRYGALSTPMGRHSRSKAATDGSDCRTSETRRLADLKLNESDDCFAVCEQCWIEPKVI